MATGYLHAAFESTPGNETNTPTLSTKVIYFPLITAKPDLNPDPMERDDELRNQDEPLAVLEEAHTPAWSFASRAYPDLLGFQFKNMLGSPATTAGNGVITDQDGIAIPTNAYRHVWTAPFGPGGVSPQTSQLQFSYKDQSVFFKLKGAATESLAISTPETGGARIEASGPAAYMVRQSDPALSPTYEALTVRPFTRGNLTLPTFLAGSNARFEDFSVNIAQNVDLVRSLGVASKFPDIVEKGDGLIVVSGSANMRTLDVDDYDALKAATGFALTARWVNDSIIASSYPYKMYVVCTNAQYTGGDVDDLDNRRRHGANFNWKATYAGSTSVTIQLVNATSSYA